MGPTAIRAGCAFVELFADDSMLVRTLRRAESQVIKFGNHLKTIGRRLMTLGLAMSIPFAASVKTFAAFDDMMRAVKAAVGATEKEFEHLTAKAKTLGRTTSFTAVQVAAAMLELARAGFNPTNIDVAIASLLDLARATGTELAEATEIAVNSMYSFELTATDMTRVCDVMVAAANGAAMTLEDLGYSMSYCAPIAKEYGITLEDTCKIIGALSNYGIKASQAGTTFRRILTNLADVDIQKRLRGFGVEVVDVDTGNMREVSEVLRDLGRATERMPKDKKLTLFKELFGLWAIAGGAKLTVAQFDYLIEEIDKANGAAQRTAQEMDAGIGGSLRRMWAVIEGVAIALGGALAPSLKQVTDWWRMAMGGVIAYIDKNQELVVETVKYISIIIGVGAALVTLSLGFLAVGKTIALVAMSFAGMARVILSVYGLIGGIFNTIRFVAGSFIAVFGGIASALGAVVSLITGVMSGLLSVFFTLGATIISVMATVAHVVLIIIVAIIRDLFLVARALIAVVTFLVPIFVTMMSVLMTVISALVTAVIAGVSFIISALMPVFTALLTAIAPLIATCITSFTLLAAAIAGAVTPIITIITSSFIIVGAVIARTMTGIIAAILPPIISFCSFLVTTIGTAIATFVAFVSSAVLSAVSIIVSYISTAILATVAFMASTLASLLAITSIVLAGVIQVIGIVLAAVLSAMSPIYVVLLTLAAMGILVYRIMASLGIMINAIANMITTVLNGLVNIVLGCLDIIVTLILRMIALILSPVLALFSWILSGLWNLVRQIGSILATAVENIVATIQTTFMSAWNGLVTTFNTVFSMLRDIIAGFGNFFLNVFNKIGIALDWLRQRFGTLCSFAVETYRAIVAALGRGDLEAALGVIWATLKLIWVQGATSLLATWYWVVETLQMAWTVCVFKIAEILTTAWYGVQQFWTETVYTMQTLWTELANGIISAWKRAEQAIARGIGWIMAKLEGLDPNEMANLINEDYNRQSQQREAERSQRLNEIEQNRNTKTASLQQEQAGILANLKDDFTNAANKSYPEHQAKMTAQEQELAQAKAAYWDAINRAKNPPPTPERMEQESLAEKLKQQVGAFASGRNLESNFSVTGSFSAAAMQTMGIGSVMDRVAKATEKSEKYLEKIANKETKTEKEKETKKQPEQNNIYEGDVPVMKELQQQTRFLRDISERGNVQKFA
jgi:TP901 family phage tail tape measure protein